MAFNFHKGEKKNAKWCRIYIDKIKSLALAGRLS